MQFKLLYDYETSQYLMYNITDDIGEANNLLDTADEVPSYRGVAESLSLDLRRWLDETGAIYPLLKTGANAGQEVPPPPPFR